MTRQTGRPADETGRLAKEIRTYDFLDANHVWYERIDHEAAMTMEVCEEIDKALERQSARTCSCAIARRRTFIC